MPEGRLRLYTLSVSHSKSAKVRQVQAWSESLLGVYGARTRNLRRDRGVALIGTVTPSSSHSSTVDRRRRSKGEWEYKVREL
jgi:hypothetical protein